MKYILLIGLLNIVMAAPSFAQSDSSKFAPAIFERISVELKNYKLDTSAVPNDKITRLINELRNLRGGFNINEAIEFKIAEDKQKNEISEAEAENLSLYFKKGNGRKWLDNAITWIYREQFTAKELKRLIRFYKSSTGQKMANEFPLLMMKSLMAGEAIKAIFDARKLPQ